MLLLLLARLVHAAPEPSAAPMATLPEEGPASSVLDLWRAYPGSDKVFVSVGLPDGSEGLFLFDTGASISVLNRDVADRLGLSVEPVVGGLIQGLSGSVGWNQAIVPTLRLGDHELRDLVVAVDVPGAPDSAGPLAIAGILGNNVWAHFTCVVDYPADTLELWRAGAFPVPRRATPMPVEGLHPMAEVGLVSRSGERANVLLEVDTGARDLLLFGAAGEPFRGASSRGIEPVFGIGASLDELPLESFLRDTRRVEIARVDVGGRKLKTPMRARWYEADGARPTTADWPGLLGYLAFADHRVILDFPGERLWVGRSPRPARQFDAVGAALAKELAAGADPARAARVARLQHAKGDDAAARATVDAALVARPDDAELAGLRAGLRLAGGDFGGALAALAAVSPQALLDEGLWGIYVNTLVLDGQVARARQVAEDALGLAPDDPAARSDLLVALADALLADGRANQAAAALQDAVRLSPAGSAHLLRRARASAAGGDRHAALAALRDLVRVYPLDGIPLWLYAELATPADVPTFLADLDAALARLHPGDEPWDFVGVALLTVGQAERGRAALRTGEARDCAPLPDGADRANCEAWYWALGGERAAEASARADAALLADPWNPAFHDTAAVVARVRGDTAGALDHARVAARLSPDDPYLLWQVGRAGVTLSPSP